MIRTAAKVLVALSFIFVLFSLSGETVQAANLYFSPSSGSYSVGQTISVGVYVSSADQTMNAASGVISFPSDKLEVTSLSNASSIFSLWVLEPSFSNSIGSLNFEGIVLNPGFVGAAGKIITINFKTKAAGNPILNFFSGSVLANDGKGTNILSNLSTAQFSLSSSAITPPTPSVTPPAGISGTPTAPIINSSTHPNPDKWYSNSTPEFSWEVPSDVTAVRLLIGKIPIATPTVLYSPAISEKKLDKMEDGEYYFHVRFRNQYGWGAITHRKILIDTQPPEPFSIEFPEGKKTDNPQPPILFKTTDSMSGIDHYKVKINNGDFVVTTEKVLSDPYLPPLLESGKQTVVVQAYDKAGNYVTASNELTILPIKTPKVTEYPKKLKEGEIIIIKGESDLEVTVTVWLKKEGEEPFAQNIVSDKEGNFEFVSEKTPKRGIYKFWLTATDSRGAKSEPSEEYVIVVGEGWLSRIIIFFTKYLSPITLLLFIIFGLLCLFWYGWYRFNTFKKKIKKETKEAETTLNRVFALLKEEIRGQIKGLKKTEPKEKEKVTKKLEEDLDIAEKFINKEIKDIEKETKK